MNIQFTEAPIATFLFGNTKVSWFWLIARVYLGWQWLEAGWDKLHSAVWMGGQSGVALSGFVHGALAKMSGAHPDVQSWYGWFLSHVVLPHPAFWSHLVTYGEILVGVALILGLFTGIAAFFGLFMNFNFLLAGTVSVNPILFVLGLFIVFAWKVAGYIGLDRYILPRLGTYWQPGTLFTKS